jgi:hypothetical protein
LREVALHSGHGLDAQERKIAFDRSHGLFEPFLQFSFAFVALFPLD